MSNAKVLAVQASPAASLLGSTRPPLLPPHARLVVRLCVCVLTFSAQKDTSHPELGFTQMNSFQPNCSLKTLSRSKPCHVEVPGLRTSTREF